MSTRLYRLEPSAPFHFGERGVGIEATEDILHSDTLFSALCCTLIEMGEGKTLRELLKSFQEGNPPFLLSSAFPYAGTLLFFPKPILRPDLEGTSDELRRKYKDVRFLSQGIWEAFLEGESVASYLKQENLLQDGSLWVTDSEKVQLPKPTKFPFWCRDIVPRVTIDRVSSTSSIFHAGRVIFSQNCGLYFLIEFREEFFRNIIDQALLLLADAGLGGERSSGHGQFKLRKSEPFPPFEGEGSVFLTLSLYNPTQEEISQGVLKNPASYEITERRGWIYSPSYSGKYRKSVRMLAEGSLFCPLLNMAFGQLANVTPAIESPPHPVYRYGFAFPVAVTIKRISK